MTTYDRLQFESQQDERRTLESQGLVSPHLDGSPRTVVAGCHRGMTAWSEYRGHRRAQCSCGYAGTWTTDYATALRERNAHRCSTTQALEILRQNGSL